MEASSGYKDYVAGLMAGIATITSGHPFDTVKVKLQKYYTEAGGVKYKNGLHRATGILQIEEGEVDVGKPQPHAIVPSVAFGGAIMSFILCPSELVKCRMQVQGTDFIVPKSTRFSGPLQCALKTVKQEEACFEEVSPPY